MINYQEKRTKVGKMMYNFMIRSGNFLSKHLRLYYLLNYTWGILITLTGYVFRIFIKIFLKNKIVDKGVFGPCHYTQFGNNWGGVSLGRNFFLADKMGKNWTLHTKQHELGHTFQNAILGPLFIFLVAIPSVFRYWLSINSKLKCDYDQVWFEGSATDIGITYYKDRM